MNMVLSGHSKQRMIYILCFFSLIFLVCSEYKSKSQEDILAKIDNRIITVEDYLKRSELTLRPSYCDGKSESDKQIILNSLICEKLFALEGEKDTLLTNNKSFQTYLTGIKEQAMQTQLLEMEVDQKIRISNEEKRAAVRKSTIQYNIAYLFSTSKEKADVWRSAIDQTKDFDLVAREIYGNKPVPEKEVLWGEIEESLENAIFQNSVAVGSIIGPVKTSVGYYLLQVKDLKKSVILGEGSLNEKLSQVEKRLRTRKWMEKASTYVSEMMKDETIELDPFGFNLLVQAYQNIYITTGDSDNFPEPDNIEMGEVTRDALRQINKNRNEPLLTINHKPWSLYEFTEYTKKHPLIFRSKRISKQEFSSYLKLAIQDLIRDKYLSEKAYKKNLDKSDYVNNTVQHWHDHLLAIGKRNLVLKNMGFQGHPGQNIPVLLNFLRPHIDLMKKKYTITKEWEKLKDISVTDIQWVSIREDVPYPQVVPPFPIITNDDRSEILSAKH